MRRIVIFEFNDFHTGIFPIYHQYLPALLNDKHLKLTFFTVPHAVKELQETGINVQPITSGLFHYILKKLHLMPLYLKWKTQKIIKCYKPDVVIFNSIEPYCNFELFRQVLSKKHINIAILHNPELFEKEDKPANCLYFVLSDIIYKKYLNSVDGYMLPFMASQHILSKQYALEKERLIMVGIQGHVDFYRRDYLFLIEISKEFKKRRINRCVFNIIGCLHKEQLEAVVKEENLSMYFIFHSHLIDQQFSEEINRCDYIMPLLGKEHQKYYKDKATTSLFFSAAYNKPMILTEENARAWCLPENVAITYTDLNSALDVFVNISVDMALADEYKSYIDHKIEENLAVLSQFKQHV